MPNRARKDFHARSSTALLTLSTYSQPHADLDGEKRGHAIPTGCRRGPIDTAKRARQATKSYRKATEKLQKRATLFSQYQCENGYYMSLSTWKVSVSD